MINRKLFIVLVFILLQEQLDFLKADWVRVSNGLTVLEINALTSYSSGGVDYLFAGTPSGSIDGGIYVSTNNGTTWTLNMHDLNMPFVWALSNSSNGALNFIYAGGRNNFLRSSNNGINWVTMSFPNGNRDYYAIETDSNIVFTGCAWNTNDSGGIYKSTNFGDTWHKTLDNASIHSIAVNGNYVYAVAGWPYSIQGVLKSTDYGETWTLTALNNNTFYSVGVNGNYVYAGGDYGVYLSTNNGINWNQTSLNNALINSIIVYNNAVFCGGYGANKFFYSTNNGITWQTGDTGLNNQINSLCISNNYIFAGTNINGVFRRPLMELIGIMPILNEVPHRYKLFQNFPNPFNPVTKIRFQIPEHSNVKLFIHDIRGQLLSGIVNEYLKPGTYEIDWNAGNFSSGIYYYTLETNDFKETKKLVLLK